MTHGGRAVPRFAARLCIHSSIGPLAPNVKAHWQRCGVIKVLRTGQYKSSTRLIEQIAKVGHCLLAYIKQAFLRAVEIGDEINNRGERDNNDH